MADILNWWELDNPSLGNILAERARRAGDEVFILFENRQITIAEFNEQANRAANGLLQAGIKKADKVCLCLPNCPEWLYLWFGMAKIGAVLVPVMPGLPGPYFAHVIKNSEAETIIIHSSLLDMFQTAGNAVENLKNVIVDARGAAESVADLPPDAVFLEQLFESSADPPCVDVRHPDVAYIVYTSGTTGFPKGVVVRHPAPVPKPAEPSGQHLDSEQKPPGIAYMCYPMHTWFNWVPDRLRIGAIVAFSRKQRIDRFWDDIRRYKAAEFLHWSGLIPDLLSQPEKPDDADNPAQACIGIMTPRDGDIIAAFEKRFSVKVLELYGSTEGGNVTTNLAGKPGSVGKPNDGVEVKIIDSEGNEVRPYEVGEIVHRRKSGKPITVEYYRMPEESAAKTRDGWYHSDDLAYRDEEGYLYFVDRKLDTIKMAGKEVYASTIEMAVSQHPGVHECIAVGIPRGPVDDDIKLSVICKEGTTITQEEMLAFCRERLEDYMAPRYIEFRDSFPRSSRGKVQRHKLRAEGVIVETRDRQKAEIEG